MARPGVTYQDIANAAHELKGQGKNVTIESVRAILGTGSIGTINQHLRKWKEAQQSTQHIASKENLPHDLIALMKGLWEGVVTQAAEQFHPAEEAYKQEILTLKNELEKYKSNNKRWQKLFNQWQQERLSLANEKLTLEQALEFAHKENHSLHGKLDGIHQQLQEKQERIDELHRLHQQTQHNLEHYRESAREQRLLDQQQFEQQKQELQSAKKTLKEQMTVLRERVASLQQQHQTLQQTHMTLEKNYTENQSKFENQKQQLIEMEKVKNEHHQASLYWQNQHQDIQKSLEVKSMQLIDIHAEAKVLSQQLLGAKQSLNDALDQNKLLAHEKWILAQEKAQMEGQLKQMQAIVGT